MRGALRFIAFGLAILFVIVTVPVLFATSLGQVVTNREVIKENLNADDLLMNAVEVSARETLKNQPAISNLPDIIRDSEPLQAAIDNFFPPGWAGQQSDLIIDAVFDYLDTGDEDSLVLHIDVGPLLESLKGDPGRQLVLATLQSLPPCTDELPIIDFLSGTIELNGCLPPLIPIDLLAGQLHNLVVLAVDSNTVESLVGDTINIDLLGLDPTVSGLVRARLEQFRQVYLFGKQSLWLLWILPLACLFLIVPLAVRSPGAFGHWWGWPVLITAVLALLGSFAVPTLINFIFNTSSGTIPPTSIAFIIDQIIQSVTQALSGLWLVRVRTLAGLGLIWGVFLVAVGFITTWMLAGQPTADTN
ncbi:MAG: hypothetical protein WAM60_08135 [Candidatus Promineifilaceae bacterium]